MRIKKYLLVVKKRMNWSRAELHRILIDRERILNLPPNEIFAKGAVPIGKTPISTKKRTAIENRFRSENLAGIIFFGLLVPEWALELTENCISVDAEIAKERKNE